MATKASSGSLCICGSASNDTLTRMLLDRHSNATTELHKPAGEMADRFLSLVKRGVRFDRKRFQSDMQKFEKQAVCNIAARGC
jgi:hypothetical protein